MEFYILVDRTPVLVNMEMWAEWFTETDRRRVCKTKIGDSTEVSTVFLGIEHDYSRDGPPILFETMIFGGPLDGDMWRCATYNQAEAQHQAAVALATKADQRCTQLAEMAGAKRSGE